MKSDIDELVKKLRNKDWRTRKEAAQELGELGGEKAIKVLINGLSDKNWRVRKAIINSLIKIGQPALDPLIETLETEVEVAKREYAAKALGLLGDTKAVESLIEALKDENENVRDKAAQALGEIKDERAIKPLEAALSDVHWFVRKSAAASLNNYGLYKE
ncbi:MAG: HEAT repeat domain-containing protein [Archaeoglobaceae archaeon]